MNTKTPLIPGPSHPISIIPQAGTVLVKLGERIIADTRNALTLTEASYPPVQYIPRADVDMTLLARSEHSTYCPYKGGCSYYSIPLGGEKTINSVWTYENPYPAVAAIKEYLAFYPNRVEILETAQI